jgi:hypothetical protein
VLDNAVVVSGSDSSSFDMTLYQGSAVPQPVPDADLGPVNMGMYSGSLATVIITASGSEDTSSIGYAFQGGTIVTTIVTDSGADSISDAAGNATPGLNMGLYSGSLSP